MKIIELDFKTFREILEMEDSRLDILKGYDLDGFASACASGHIKDVESHQTKASVDILYIKDSQLYKIEGKDISKVILNKAFRPHLSNVDLSEHYIKGVASNRDKRRIENGEDVKLKNKVPIDMKSKIEGTEYFLNLLEDSKEHDDKGYFLIINYNITEELVNNLSIEDRIKFENGFLLLGKQIKKLKSDINSILSKQEGFKICDIADIYEICK